MTPRPRPRPTTGWSFPQPTTTTFDNGLTLWAYDLPGQFVLSATLVLELPFNAEPAPIEGVATITARALDEGTRAHPGPRFAQALEDAGAQFDGSAGPSTTQCSIDVPQEELETGLALLAEAVTSPAFDPADVERVVANRLAEIEQQESYGGFVAALAQRQALIDQSLRLSRPVGGRAETVAAITRGAVADFHQANYRPQAATLIVAGDLNGLDPTGIAQGALGGWQAPASRTTPQTPAPGPGGRRLIHRPGSVQADISLGWYGIDQHDESWAALQVALAIMGGTFTSRLNHALREQRGYTYGVSMRASSFRRGGTVKMTCSARTEVAPALIEEALEILRAEPGFTAQEVQGTIDYLTFSAPLAFDTAEAVAAQAAGLAAARLELDQVDRHLADLARVTPESAMAAYRSLIDPERASVVVVADADRIGDLGFR